MNTITTEKILAPVSMAAKLADKGATVGERADAAAFMLALIDTMLCKASGCIDTAAQKLREPAKAVNR